MRTLALILAFALAALGQSTQNSYAGLDVSGAPSSKPGTHVASDPAEPCSPGSLIYRTDLGSFRYCNRSSVWADLGGGSVTPGYGILSEGGAVTWNPADPRYVAVSDEFIGKTGVSMGSWGVGQLQWRFGNDGTCNQYVNSPGAWPNYYTAQLNTAASANTYCWLNHQASGYGATFGSPYSNSDKLFELTWIFKITDTADIEAYAGMQGIYSGNPPGDKGLYWRFIAGTDTYWTLVSRSSSTDSIAASTVAPDTGYHTFKIYSDGATANKLYANIDGGTPLTVCASGCDITSNISTGDLQPWIAVKATAASSKNLFADFFSIRMKVSTTAGKRN